VLPGSLGLAQVQLPPDTDVRASAKKLLYDLHYVASCGLLLDLRILLCTGLHVVGVPVLMLLRLGLVPGPEHIEQSRHEPPPRRRVYASSSLS